MNDPYNIDEDHKLNKGNRVHAHETEKKESEL